MSPTPGNWKPCGNDQVGEDAKMETVRTMDAALSATDGMGSADADGVPGAEPLTRKPSKCTASTAGTGTGNTTSLLPLPPGVRQPFPRMSCFRPPSSRPDHPPRARELLLLLPFCAALGIFAAVAVFVSLVSAGGLERGHVSAAAAGVPVVDLRAGAGPDFGYSGLIDPHNGDNGTDPAQTTTVECTGDFTLPVLDGVDLVSYFSLADEDSPIYGTDSYMSLFGSYRFYFSSIQNLQVFEEKPEKYLPAYGGFCSYGVANEPVWTSTTLGPFGDPSKWAIFPDGRLHIFRSAVPLAKFRADVSGNIERGNDVWQTWFGETGKPLNTACICADTICDDQ